MGRKKQGYVQLRLLIKMGRGVKHEFRAAMERSRDLLHAQLLCFVVSLARLAARLKLSARRTGS